MSGNTYKRFLALLPADPLLVGEVTAHNTDGTSDVELPGATTIRAQGQTVAVGLRAFVQGGRVIGEAPDLPYFEVEV